MNAELKMTGSSFSFAAPEELKVNLLDAPFGIPRQSPTFSWAMRSGEVGDIQTSYRIFIAHRLSDMKEGDYLLDTGWIATDESSNVRIAGLDTLLRDNELYYWAVQLRNKNGIESAVSDPVPFSTAVGEDWESTRGIWSEDAEGGGNFSFLRSEVRITDVEDIERALISVTATSPEPSRQYVYHLFVNGHLVGLGPTRMGKSFDGEEILYYNTYDVTSLLREDVNVISALNYTMAEKGFLCQLTVFYDDGDKKILLNSARDAEAFRALDGKAAFCPDQSIGTGYFKAEAENINAEQYPFGFENVDFDASAWHPAVLREDLEISGERLLAPYPSDPVGRYEQEVALVENRGDGHYFIDLGREVIGGLRLTLTADAPHTIRLCFGEELNEDGSVRYRMRTSNVYLENWTLKEGVQTLENYSLKTFRYVDIFDCQAELKEEDVKAIAIRKAFDADASSFACSNEVLCHLYDTFKYAICATNQDLYVDSQSRERCAYEGDALINMLSAYTYEASMALPRFSIEYLMTHRTWPAEYALMPVHMVRLDYLYSGDRSLLERSYPWLRNMMLSERPDPEVGLFPSKAAPHNGWNSILVDWPSNSRDGYEMQAAYYNTVYNAMMHISLRDMAVMAHVLGKEDDATAFRADADALRHSMIERLYDSTQGAFRDGLTREGAPVEHFAQHATVFALCTGVYGDAAMKDTLGRRLVGQETIRTSIYGAFFHLDALYHAGFGAYATALLADGDLTPGIHSFASSLYNGNVTIAPEAWNVGEKANMTFSHPWGSAPASMIVRGMFGIRPTRPGFHKFEVRPQIGDLPYASIRVPTVKGAIVVSLGQNREAYEAEITVPANTKATVYLPAVAGGTDTLFINSQKSNFPLEDGCFTIELGAGTHRLLAQ